MIPTDDDLNAAMAVVCGWTVKETNVTMVYSGYIERIWVNVSPDGIEGVGVDESQLGKYRPQYCTDRNALSEVWGKLVMATKEFTFLSELKKLTGGVNWNLVTANPRLMVIAALKALDKWPEHWDVP